MKSIFSFFFVVKAIWVSWYHNLWNSFPVEFPWFLLGDQIDHRKEPTNERLLKEEEKIVKLRVTRKVRLNLELKLLGIIKSLWQCMFRNNYRLCIYYLNHVNISQKGRLGSQFYIQLVFKAPLCITLMISDQNHYIKL